MSRGLVRRSHACPQNERLKRSMVAARSSAPPGARAPSRAGDESHEREGGRRTELRRGPRKGSRCCRCAGAVVVVDIASGYAPIVTRTTGWLCRRTIRRGTSRATAYGDVRPDETTITVVVGDLPCLSSSQR